MIRKFIISLFATGLLFSASNPLDVYAETISTADGMYNQTDETVGDTVLDDADELSFDEDNSFTTVCEQSGLLGKTKDNSTATYKETTKEIASIAFESGGDSVTATQSNRSTYISVFSSPKGKGYTLNQAKSSAKSTYYTSDYIYVWGYLHDGNGNLYKSYGSGTVNLTISIYRPNGSCAYTYTYYNSDCNWIGIKLSTAGTWKIESKVSGSLNGTATSSITVNQRSTRLTSFASPKGKGYSLSQAKASAKRIYTKGDFVYLWGYLHDGNGNLYNSYGTGTVNMTFSFYRPNGSCAYTYTYNNCDCNWAGVKLDTVGTWTLECKLSGALTGKTSGTITVNKPKINSAILAVDYKDETKEAVRNDQSVMHYLMLNNKIADYQVSAENQHTLFSSSTSVEYVNKFLDNAFANSGDNDINIFYFSGHGAKTHIGLGGGNSYNYSSLAKKLSSYKGKMIVILDTCHSEGFIRNGINNLTDRSRIYAICSCGYEETSSSNAYVTYKNLRYSAFTYTLGSAMGFFYPKDALSGNLSVTSLYNYVNRNISKICKTMHPQLYRPDNYALYIFNKG